MRFTVFGESLIFHLTMQSNRLLDFFLLITLISALPNARAESPAMALFNGQNMAGWRKPTGDWLPAKAVSLNQTNQKMFSIQEGQGIVVNGAKGRTENLLTEMEFGDLEAHVEFNVPKDSNSGVYFMGRYEIQVLDSWGVKDLKYGDCGGVYASCSEPKPDFHGRPPSVNASKPPGEWQSYDIVFRAPRFDSAGKKVENARFLKVTHNGQMIHENVEVPRPTCAAHWLDEKASGPLMLQGDHGPVAYRNIVVRKVNLK